MIVLIRWHNAFRLIADCSHVLAIVILLLKIWLSGSCAGISGKSQVLYVILFVSRYLDLAISFISVYNSAMKVFFILVSCVIVYLIYIKHKDTYNGEHDTFKIAFLLVPTFCLALSLNHEKEVVEVFWAFSIYLEAVAIIPQLYMIFKMGKADSIVCIYLFTLASYRAFYILNWICRYYEEHYYDLIAAGAGCVQVAVYCGFFYLYHIVKIVKSNAYDSSKLKEKNIFSIDVEKQQAPML